MNNAGHAGGGDGPDAAVTVHLRIPESCIFEPAT
jgi:hypothetical protein